MIDEVIVFYLVRVRLTRLFSERRQHMKDVSKTYIIASGPPLEIKLLPFVPGGVDHRGHRGFLPLFSSFLMQTQHTATRENSPKEKRKMANNL